MLVEVFDGVDVSVGVGVDVCPEFGLETAFTHSSSNTETHATIPAPAMPISLHQKPHLPLRGFGLKPGSKLLSAVWPILAAIDSFCFFIRIIFLPFFDFIGYALPRTGDTLHHCIMNITV